MRRSTRAATAGLAALLVLGAGACSDDAEEDARDAVDDVRDEAEDAASTASSAVDEGSTDAVEAAVRNLAATHCADELERAGHPVDGDLTCEATEDGGAGSVAVSCEGTTTDGEDATVEGTTSEVPGASATELEGDFTGTVAGEEVFSTDRLGG